MKKILHLSFAAACFSSALYLAGTGALEVRRVFR